MQRKGWLKIMLMLQMNFLKFKVNKYTQLKQNYVSHM